MQRHVDGINQPLVKLFSQTGSTFLAYDWNEIVKHLP